MSRAGPGDRLGARGRGRGLWDRLLVAGLWGRWIGVGLLVAGCGREPELEGAALRAAAAELWQGRCANCHGVDGRGDGPTGMGLVVRPRDFHDPAWQASRDDAWLRRVIVEGGGAHGLSSDMAANADLEGRPGMVTELVRVVRGFGAQP
jgi:mono/diheme cytochrome c family protein